MTWRPTEERALNRAIRQKHKKSPVNTWRRSGPVKDEKLTPKGVSPS